MRKLLIGLGVAMLGATTVGRAAEAPKPYVATAPVKLPMDFNHFYPYEEIVDALHRLNRAFPDLSKVYSIGKTREGRDLVVIEISNFRKGDPTQKPGIFIDGNIHGNEIQGSEVALFTAWYLLNRYDLNDPYVRKLVDDRTWYILPVLNVDSRVRFFTQANNPNAPRHNSRPVDNDRDGLFDEDPPMDLDGDGQILQMRIRDPFGNLKSGADPRELEGRDTFERGVWRMLGNEGLDRDGDGRTGEDGIGGGLDMNRNYPANWAPPHRQGGAGPYPTSEPEILAEVLFADAHPNIVLVQNYHNNGNYILYGPSDRPSAQGNAADVQVYNALGQRGLKFLPDYTQGTSFDLLYNVNGGSLDFHYLMHGAWAFTNELWRLEPQYRTEGDGEQQLKFNDEVVHGMWFTPWHKFTHPVYGEVEIGGWNQFSSRVPPADYLPEMCQRNCLFTLFKATQLAELSVEEATAEALGGGVYKVKVRVANLGSLPTRPAETARNGAEPPVVVSLGAPGSVQVITSGTATRFTWEVRATEVPKQPRDARTMTIGTLPGQSDVWLVWLVKKTGSSAAKVTVTATHPKTGSASKEVTLN